MTFRSLFYFWFFYMKMGQAFFLLRLFISWRNMSSHPQALYLHGQFYYCYFTCMYSNYWRLHWNECTFPFYWSSHLQTSKRKLRPAQTQAVDPLAAYRPAKQQRAAEQSRWEEKQDCLKQHRISQFRASTQRFLRISAGDGHIPPTSSGDRRSL